MLSMRKGGSLVFEERDFGALQGPRWPSSPLPDPQAVLMWAGDGRQESSWQEPPAPNWDCDTSTPRPWAFQKPALGALLGLPKKTLQLWKHKAKEKKIF